VRGDGSVRWIHDRSFARLDARGEPDRVAGISEDITEQRHLEVQLRHARKMETIGRVTSGVAHEFNNILTAILGCNSILLADAPPDHPWREDLQWIEVAARQAADLCHQLLALGRKSPPEPRLTDLSALVRSAERPLRRVAGPPVDLELRLDPSTEPVHADPGDLTQALLNLCANARDAMPGGGRLVIEARPAPLPRGGAGAGRADPAGVYAALSILDDGAGMAPGILERAFEPFFTTKPAGAGTGLGLAAVYATTRQSGGYLQVESASGEGTRITLLLPVAEAIEVAPTRKRLASWQGTETLMVVEDDRSVRRVIVRLLRSHGFTVVAARDGAEARRIASDFAGDLQLMIVDLELPDETGVETAAAVQARWPGLQVLYITGYAVPPVPVPAADLLTKPFTPRQLFERCRRLLDRPTEG